MAPPAKRVYLIRHAKAEPDHARGDAARRLTPEGKARFARLLEELGPELLPSRVLTSPFARARQTAELLASHTGAPLEEEDGLESGASTGPQLLALASRAGDGAALVGHNPEVAEAVALAAGREEEVKPGSVAAVDLFPAGPPRLAWLRRPPRSG
jgi:phosphohistidine phosphatase